MKEINDLSSYPYYKFIVKKRNFPKYNDYLQDFKLFLLAFFFFLGGRNISYVHNIFHNIFIINLKWQVVISCYELVKK